MGLLHTAEQGGSVIAYRNIRNQDYYIQVNQGGRVITYRETRRQGYLTQLDQGGRVS